MTRYNFNRAISCLFIIAGMAGPLSATPSTAQILWEEQPQFHVEINNSIDVSSKVYRPSDNRPLLIVTYDGASAPLLINLAKKSVIALSEKSLTVRDEYSYVTKSVPKGKKVGSYRMKGGVSEFKYKGDVISISIKESLVGEVPEGVILAHSPTYGALRDAYKPSSKYVNMIKKYNKPIEVVVMFATWCPTCKQVLPKFMSIMDAANNKNFSAKYIGIGMGGSEPQEELQKYGHDYPAFIFYRNGKEIDRIIGEPNVSMEQTIAEILTKR